MRLDTCSFFWVLEEVPTWKTKVNDVKLVLLVDDDSSVRESVAEMLASFCKQRMVKTGWIY